MISNDGLIIENIDLSHIYLAVLNCYLKQQSTEVANVDIYSESKAVGEGRRGTIAPHPDFVKIH